MSRINQNIAALISVHDMNKSNAALTKSLRRLSSGLRINTAADNPSGLIISELLRSEADSLTRAISNSERAGNMIATAEGALNEVSTLLRNIRDLAVEAANEGALTTEEIQANQLQIDSAVESIARIANTTQFGGISLLNGNMGYIMSGVSGAAISDANVQGVQFGANSTVPVKVIVNSAATKAQLITATGVSAIGASGVVLEITGKLGTEVFNFAASTAGSAVIFAINASENATGVGAAVSGGRIVFSSTGYGTEAFVQVNPIEGAAFQTSTIGGSTTVNRDEGTNANASINGTLAVADGNSITVNTTLVDITLTLVAAFATSSSFDITGGGAVFQLGGDINDSQRANVGIQSIAPSQLGRGDIGYLHQIVTGGSKSLVGGFAADAASIIDQAVMDIVTLRGRLGAFQMNVIGTNINSLEVAVENVRTAESIIRDTDFAAETSELTRAEILVSAGISVLATANAMPQGVLALLG